MSENLIKLVRQHRVLYSPKCKEYKDHTSRTAAWEAIARKLGEPVEKCRDDWGRLRNAYSSALKRRRKNMKSGQTPANEIPWKYEEQMSFVRPFMILRNRKLKLMPPREPPKVESPESPISNNEVQSNSSFLLPPSPLPMSSEESQRGSQLQQEKKSEFQEICDLIRASNNMRHEMQSCLQDLDETDLFFISMGKAVKALPKQDQIKIKLHLHTAIYDAEIRNIQRQIAAEETTSTVPIPIPSASMSNFYEHPNKNIQPPAIIHISKIPLTSMSTSNSPK